MNSKPNTPGCPVLKQSVQYAQWQLQQTTRRMIIFANASNAAKIYSGPCLNTLYMSSSSADQQTVATLVAEVQAMRLRLELNEARLKSAEADNISLVARVRKLEGKRPKKNEGYYQRLLEERLGAKHQYLTGVGTTDLTT